jgi:hypothetical protein
MPADKKQTTSCNEDPDTECNAKRLIKEEEIYQPGKNQACYQKSGSILYHSTPLEELTAQQSSRQSRR